MFKVQLDFVDLQDDFYKYHAGDKYPREGSNPTDERIAELAGSDNALGQPLIKKAPAKKPRSKKEG